MKRAFGGLVLALAMVACGKEPSAPATTNTPEAQEPGSGGYAEQNATESAPPATTPTRPRPSLPLSYQKPRLVAQLGHATYPEAGWISPDGKLVVTRGADGTVAVFEVASGREVRRRETGRVLGFDGNRELLVERPDGERVAWDLERDADLRLGPVEERDWSRYTTSAAGRTLEWHEQQGRARVLDAGDGRELAHFDVGNWITGGALTPDGERACVAVQTIGAGGELASELIVVVAASGEILHRHPARGWRLLATPATGSREILCWNGATVELVELESGAVVRTLARSTVGGALRGFTSVSSDASGTRILTTSDDRSARLIDFATGSELAHFVGRTDFVRGLQLSAAGDVLLVASGTLWRFMGGGDEGQFNASENAAAVWQLARGVQGPRIPLPEEPGALDWGAALSPDGATVALGHWERLALWSAGDGKKVRDLAGGTRTDLAFTPDGKALLTFARWIPLEGEPQPFSLFQSIAVARDGGTFATSYAGKVELFAADTRALQRSFETFDGVLSVALSGDGARVHAGTPAGVLTWNRDGGEPRRIVIGEGANIHALATLPGATDAFFAAGDDGRIRFFRDGVEQESFIGHTDAVYTLVVTPDGKHLFSGGRDQSVRLWDIESGEYLARLYSFRDGTWAVVDAEGRYDAPGGESAGLHWVVGLEAIALEQLKERYYEPGLLAKLLGHSSEPLRTVDALVAQGVPLPPKAVILLPEPGSTILTVELTSCGSGIGPVAVRVNKKEIVADARPRDFDPDADSLTLTLDLAGEPAFVPELENEIEIVAEDAAEVLSARGVTVTLEPARPASGREPELWALVVGASDYAGSALDLRYAASDAKHFKGALELCASGLFAGRTHIELLSDGESAPTRESVKRGLDTLEEAHAEDVVVVYLAGHGVTLGADASDFYFVLPSALTLAGLKDPAVRRANTLAGAELRARLNSLAARKAVLILDTCHAGALADTRALTADQVRALERLKDQTGLVILAGSAKRDVSFETSRYGHGLLTYALLSGLRSGPVLDAAGNVGVLELLLHAQREVPALARALGQSQEPQLAMPRGGASFALGRLADRSAIELAVPRTPVRRPNFMRAGTPVDSAGLNVAVARQLEERVRAGALFAPGAAEDVPDAWLLGGTYASAGAELSVQAQLYRGMDSVDTRELTGSIDEVARALAEWLEAKTR